MKASYLTHLGGDHICDECGQDRQALMHFESDNGIEDGESENLYLCLDCLLDAAAILQRQISRKDSK